MELCLRMSDKPAESMSMRISGQSNMGDVVMVVCCKLSDQEENKRDLLQTHPERTSCLQTLIVLEDVNHSSVCWSAAQLGTSNPGGFWSTLTAMS